MHFSVQILKYFNNECKFLHYQTFQNPSIYIFTRFWPALNMAPNDPPGIHLFVYPFPHYTTSVCPAEYSISDGVLLLKQNQGFHFGHSFTSLPCSGNFICYVVNSPVERPIGTEAAHR